MLWEVSVASREEKAPWKNNRGEAPSPVHTEGVVLGLDAGLAGGRGGQESGPLRGMADEQGVGQTLEMLQYCYGLVAQSSHPGSRKQMVELSAHPPPQTHTWLSLSSKSRGAAGQRGRHRGRIQSLRVQGGF